MKKTNLSLLLLLIILAIHSSPLHGQDIKIGVIDRQQINDILSRKDKGFLELETEEKKLLKEMEKSHEALEAKRKLNIKNDSTITVRLEQESRQGHDALNAKRDRLYVRKEELIGVRENRIMEAIRHVAAERKYSVVLDIHSAPYYKEENNITALVLQRMGYLL